jgi:hypothetical protein
MDDNTRQVIRNEEHIVAGEPEQTTVSQTQTSTGTGTGTGAPYVAGPAVPQGRSTVQTTTASTEPSSQVAQSNYAERVIDPAAEKAAGVNWFNRLIWFLASLMAILLAIRFVLLASGANMDAGFVEIIYNLTGWMVAPFAGIFGRPIEYPAAAGQGIIEFESLLAIVVYLLIAFGITKLAELALGTNRTTGTVYSETERNVKT